MTRPSATFNVLSQADGSLEFKHAGYTILGAVNGPIEAQRRDEIPNEAALEVNIQPAAGVGTIRERHLEKLLHSTLRKVVRTRQYPRHMIQVLLQVVELPNKLDAAKSSSSGRTTAPPLLPSLLHTAYLALIAASIPLQTRVASASYAISDSGSILTEASAQDLETATSFHVFAFATHGDMLLNDSWGEFTIQQWREVCEVAQRQCSGVLLQDSGRGGEMEVETSLKDGQLVSRVLDDIIAEKVMMDLRWKQAV